MILILAYTDDVGRNSEFEFTGTHPGRVILGNSLLSWVTNLCTFHLYFFFLSRRLDNLRTAPSLSLLLSESAHRHMTMVTTLWLMFEGGICSEKKGVLGLELGTRSLRVLNDVLDLYCQWQGWLTWKKEFDIKRQRRAIALTHKSMNNKFVRPLQLDRPP